MSQASRVIAPPNCRMLLSMQKKRMEAQDSQHAKLEETNMELAAELKRLKNHISQQLNRTKEGG